MPPTPSKSAQEAQAAKRKAQRESKNEEIQKEVDADTGEGVNSDAMASQQEQGNPGVNDESDDPEAKARKDRETAFRKLLSSKKTRSSS